MTHPSTFRKPTEGRTVAFVDDLYRFLATGDVTIKEAAAFLGVSLNTLKTWERDGGLKSGGLKSVRSHCLTFSRDVTGRCPEQ